MIIKVRQLLIGILLPLFFVILALSGYAHEEETLRLNSEAAILIDATTGQVLYEKSMNQSMYPASITKILTGIIAIEEGNLDDIVTVSQNARNVVGTRVYLVEGEQVPLLKLVQGLLINSGNDAGTAIAEYFDESEETFAKRMNQFAKDKIGVTNTNFTNPHGLFHANHQTTAYDMAMITRYAMKNEVFREIVATKEMEWIGEGWETILYNHHKLLWRYAGANGVKNGFVNQSGHTLITSAKRGNTEFIVVTLKASSSENAYQDAVTLLDYGFSHFQTNQLPKGKTFLDTNQSQYRLPQDTYFTSKLNEGVIIEVNHLGELLIKGEDQEVILKQRLEKVEEVIEAQAVTDDQIEMKNSENVEPLYQRVSKYILWILMFIYQLFLFLISYLLIRKYRLRNKARTLEIGRTYNNHYWG